MENKKRLIDADALVAELKDNRDNDSNRYMYWYQKEERDAKYDFAINWIYDAPTVDAVEVVHAAWTDKGFCTNCGYRAYIACVGFNCTGGIRVEYERTPYCAGCGAKMDRKDDT